MLTVTLILFTYECNFRVGIAHLVLRGAVDGQGLIPDRGNIFLPIGY
jgi:hypothetical protein